MNAPFVVKDLLVVCVIYVVSQATARQCPQNNCRVPVKGTRCPSSRMGPKTQNVDIITAATIKSKLEMTLGKMGGVVGEIMLDSGASFSLVKQEILSGQVGGFPSKLCSLYN